MPAVAVGVNSLVSTFFIVGGPGIWISVVIPRVASHGLGLRLRSSFREERFSDRVSASTAEGTTCYPGRRQGDATAHYGVSVTIKGSENERAQ